MKIMVINGPNINMLGIREPDIYGKCGFDELEKSIKNLEQKYDDLDITLVQSNFEGQIVTQIQNAYFQKYDGIIINPAAYTHTSIAILDALKSVGIPAVEIHISHIANREEFRHRSYTSYGCIAQITGFGTYGYTLAVDGLYNYIKNLEECR